MSRASLDKDPAEVAAMFDEVAPRYDLTNTVLSLGQDRGWRREVRRAWPSRPGSGCSTSPPAPPTSSAALAATGADVVGCDFSLGMLQVGRGPATRASSWSPATPCACRSPTARSTP
jgi:demethylmenaquinone methyltransferase/2-methoxy-6-polyprenyl-1,4-benzoquinol methylase